MELLPEPSPCKSIAFDALQERMEFVSETELLKLYTPKFPSNSIEELLDDPGFQDAHAKWFSATVLPHTDEQIGTMVQNLLYVLKCHVPKLAILCEQTISKCTKGEATELCYNVWTILDKIALEKQHMLSIKSPCCGRPSYDFWCNSCMECLCHCQCETNFENFLKSI